MSTIDGWTSGVRLGDPLTEIETRHVACVGIGPGPTERRKHAKSSASVHQAVCYLEEEPTRTRPKTNTNMAYRRGTQGESLEEASAQDLLVLPHFDQSAHLDSMTLNARIQTQDRAGARAKPKSLTDAARHFGSQTGPLR